MTRLAWIHDHTFVYLPSGEVASEGKLPASIWDRYLEAFDEVVVCARGRSLESRDSLDRLSQSSRPNVHFYRFESLSRVSALLAPPPNVTGRLKEIIAASDAVVARVPSELGLLALKIARRLDRPAAVEVVGCAWDAYRTSGRLAARVYAPLAFVRMRRAVRQAPFALYVSRRFLQRRYPCPGVSIGCSDVELVPAPPEAARRRRESMDARRAVIGVIGSLATNVKGVDTAIQALARFPSAEGRPLLRVLGGGDPSPLREYARRYGVENDVKFDGTRAAGVGVNEWLSGIDIYLQPSRTEGIPRSLLEAMASGCPAIASGVGGIPELLDQEVLHAPGDSRALHSLLVKAVQSASWRAEQSSRNLQVAVAYRREILDPVRSEFWHRFADYARARAGQRRTLAPGSEAGG